MRLAARCIPVASPPASSVSNLCQFSPNRPLLALRRKALLRSVVLPSVSSRMIWQTSSGANSHGAWPDPKPSHQSHQVVIARRRQSRPQTSQQRRAFTDAQPVAISQRLPQPSDPRPRRRQESPVVRRASSIRTRSGLFLFIQDQAKQPIHNVALGQPTAQRGQVVFQPYPLSC